MLVGGSITVKGSANHERRGHKVAAAKRTMDRIAGRGARRNQRMQMAERAALPKAIFGTELDPLTKGQRDDLRKKASWVAWGNKHWLRGAAATMTLIEKGHRLDARQAQPYHQLTLWRRIMSKSDKIKEAFERV